MSPVRQQFQDYPLTCCGVALVVLTFLVMLLTGVPWTLP